ncbi:AAEL014196-PA [Aedes aegypti]|uniref:AAEL014196-PA n=1 Tax=Aedes aegypti TaxID=7159 RepID=Q16H09_AEDAE|nr:AAEL014196-PA [Aedes aegypti]
MAIAFYIPAIDDEIEKQYQLQMMQQQQQILMQQQQNQNQFSSPPPSPTSPTESIPPTPPLTPTMTQVSLHHNRYHLVQAFHEILFRHAQENNPTRSRCLLCNKLYYLLRKVY